MVDDNLVNNDLQLQAHFRRLVLAAFGIVRHQCTLHLNVLTSGIAPLTSDLDNITDERDNLHTEMVRIGIIGCRWEMEYFGRDRLDEPINPLPEQVAVGGNLEDEVNILVIALDIQLTTERMTQVSSHISKITIAIDDFTNKRDQFRKEIEIFNTTGTYWGWF